MREIILLTIAVGALLFTSCYKSNNNLHSILADAEILADSMPTLAITKLQKIKKPSKLSDSEQADYNLLFVKSIMRSGQKLSSDSVLNKSIAFYKMSADSLHLSNAYYYRGLYNYNNSSHDTAIVYFKKAVDALPKNEYATKRAQYLRMTGYSYLSLNDAQSAIKQQKKALEYAESENDTAEIKSTLLSLAEAYKCAKNLDQSIKIYHDVINIAKQEENVDLELHILNTIASIYESNNNIPEALRYKKKAKALHKSRKDIPSMNINLAVLYYKQNMLDSASHFAQIAINGNDTYVATIAYSLMGLINQKQGRNIEELYNLKNKEKTQNLFYTGIESGRMQQKYQEEKLKNENNQLKIKQQEHKLFSLIVLFLTFALIIVFIFIWRENKRKNERTVLKHLEDQLKNENLLLKQKQEISALREKESALRESLFKRINVFNKVPSLNIDDVNCKRNNKIKLSDEDWDELIRGIQDAYTCFLENLKQKAIKLTEDDIRFCCLLKINVDMQDLSDIYCVSKAAITKRKYRLKIDKFKVIDNAVNLNTLVHEV